LNQQPSSKAASTGPIPGGPHADSGTAKQQETALETYSYVCGTALVLIGLVLFRRGLFPWAMFPVGAGLLGLFFRWRIAPALVIGITGSCIVYAEPGGQFIRGQTQRLAAGVVDLQTWILCSALLAYVIGHFRLQALSGTIFPGDRRLPKKTGSADLRLSNQARSFHLERPMPKTTAGKNSVERPRLGRTVDGGEISGLVFTIPCVSFAGLLVLRLLPAAQSELGFFANASWSTLVLLWIVGLGVLVVNGVIVYLSLHHLRMTEARVYFQDLLWLELRRDLRRLNRWVVWSRLRKEP
jgi:hypothetical protein